MKVTKEQAYKKITELVEQFGEHVEEYKRNGYNEHQTRVDYINPFFKALGWDMDNRQGHAEAYREVIHEDKIKVGGATKAPDYGFTLYGQRKFFVDAKKPAVNIKGNIAPAYQVRRYGWSAKVPLSIVTDFEEFSIYDCTKKPNPKDKASVSRIRYITYDQYLDEFDFLWDVFAKENLPKGRFDKYVKSDTRKKGTATVDDEFLKSIEEWRRYLATTIALRNKTLSEDELNYAIQKIIDRIIFLRMCEDRGVEQYGQLKKAAQKGVVYQNLFALYRMADNKYNSGLFDFKEDKITPSLIVDNKVMKIIIKELYYPNCEYEFSVMPADILGSVYERFLGKTIRLTEAHYAKIEEKPEVRKAGGVYYTPKYVVDYIVENTVGKLIDGKTPKQVEKIKICDPACGSGSFLIGAYQFLLDWHIKYYMDNLQKKPARSSRKSGGGKKDNPLTPDGNLTTAEKKRILLNNIFGVDIDAQAVEVTKLNLLLKALEGETKASISHQLTLFHERVLPNLGSNIKCGNSLIGHDFYDNQLDLFSEQMKKINAFDWEEGFSEIFENGGFDVVIGNPPYVRQELISECKSYFETHYQTYHGSADLYQYFIEKGIGLLNPKGYFSYIVANKWMRANYGTSLRSWLKTQRIKEVTDFGDLPVFEQATAYPCIIVAQKGPVKPDYSLDITQVKTLDFNSLSDYVQDNKYQITTKFLVDKGWSIESPATQNLLKKLGANGAKLTDFIQNKIYYGIKTGLNEAFVIDKDEHKKFAKSKKHLKPFLAGRDVKRYQIPVSDKHLILFPKGVTNANSNSQQAWQWLTKNFSGIAKHLRPFQAKGEKRYDQGDYWWELRTCEYYDEFEKPKIVLPCIAKVASFTFDKGIYYSNDKTSIIPSSDLYLLGVLNSKACDFYLKSIASTKRGGYYEYKPMYVSQLPIPNPDEQSRDQITKLVDNLLKLNEQLQTIKLETQRQQIQRAITHSEKKIDELVYALYGLTKKEIEIIERGQG